MDYFLLIPALIILFIGSVTSDNLTKIGNNEFINSIIEGDTCDLKSYPCKNGRNDDNNFYLKNSKNVGWIAKPLMEALWAFSPDPSSNKTSETCSRHVRIYQEHLRNNYLWATQMLDASTLTPGGILSGDNYQLGHFDQCVDVSVDIRNNIDVIKGQYCLAQIILNPSYEAFPQYHQDEFVEFPYDLQYNPLLSSWTKMKLTVDPSKKQRNRMYWSVCVPSSCSVEEIEAGLKERIIPVLRNKGINSFVSLDKKLCNVKSETNFTTGSIVFILFSVLSFSLVFIFSLVDIIFYRNSKWMYNNNSKKGKLESVMLSFSVYQNFVNLNKPDHSDDIDVMHGMRTYTTVLVMLGHRCMFAYGSPFHNPEFLEHRYRSFDEIFVLNGFLIVDTFFVLSGFLTCYLILIHLKKNGSFNLMLIYLHRLLRIWPLYIIILSIYINILPLIGDGPMWSLKAGVEIERCRKSWWTNILFINNYVDADICMFQSWFLTCDIHFFLFGPILAYLLHKRPKLGVFITSSLLLISIAIKFEVIYSNNLDGVLKVYMSVVEDPMTNDYVKNIYIKSHNRAGPYIVGILAAYLYFVLKRRNFKFSLFQVRFGTTVCAIVSLGSLLSAWVFYIPGRKYNVIENALYSSLHRITWSCAMSWLIIVGGTSGFGVVGPVLNLKSLVPFSRLTYAVFLTHGLVQLYSVATIRTPEYIRFPKLFWMWAGDVTVSFVLALILHLVFEAPLNGLLKILVSSFLQRGKSEILSVKEISDVKNIKQKTIVSSTSVLHKQMNGMKKRNSKGKANISTLSDSILPKVENKKL